MRQRTWTSPGLKLTALATGTVGAPVSPVEANRVRLCCAAPLTVVNSPPTHRYWTPPLEPTVITRGPMPSPMPSLVSGAQPSLPVPLVGWASRWWRWPSGNSPTLEQSWACEAL